MIHRDYHDHNGYLYAVCDEGQSTLQIIDLSGLPNDLEVVYDSGIIYAGPTTSSSILLRLKCTLWQPPVIKRVMLPCAF